MHKNLIVGRREQRTLIKDALKSTRSEFIVVYGRRRVGKTYLIKNTLGKQIDCEMTGIQKGDLQDQLDNLVKRVSCVNWKIWNVSKSFP